MATRDTFRLLHLSDLHFGTLLPKQQKPGESKSAHRFAKADKPLPDALPNILKVDPTLKCPPDAVVVSGDIGWAASADDYAYALEFFKHLKKLWPNAEIITCP